MIFIVLISLAASLLRKKIKEKKSHNCIAFLACHRFAKHNV